MTIRSTFVPPFKHPVGSIIIDTTKKIKPLFSISPYQLITSIGGGFSVKGFDDIGNLKHTDVLLDNNPLVGFRNDSGFVDFLANGLSIASKSILNGIAYYGNYGIGPRDVGMCTGDSFSNAPGEYAQTIVGHQPWINIDVRGVSGETLAQIEARFAADIAASNPDFIVGNGGINGLSTTSVASLQVSMSSIISIAKSNNIPLFWCDLSPFKNYTGWSQANQDKADEYNPWMAIQPDVTVIPLSTLLADSVDAEALDPLYDSGDGLHPNIAGFGVIGDAVAAYISNRAYRGLDCCPAYTTYESMPFFPPEAVGTKASTSLGSTSISGWVMSFADPYFGEVVDDSAALAAAGFPSETKVIEIDNTSVGFMTPITGKVGTPASPNLAVFARVLADSGTDPAMQTHLGNGAVNFANTGYRRVESLATAAGAAERLSIAVPPGCKVRFFGAEITDFNAPPVASKTAQTIVPQTLHSTSLTLTTPLSAVVNFISRVSQTAVLFHSGADATNYIQLRITPTVVVVAKSIAGVETTASIAHTHANRVGFNARFRVNTDNTIDLFVNGTGKTTNSDTGPVPYGSTVHLGSDGAISCNGVLAVTLYDKELIDSDLLSR